MSRSKKTAKRKREAGQGEAYNKKTLLGPLSPSAEASGILDVVSVDAVVSREAIDVAVETLNSLAEHPNLVKLKACRPLRAAVYGFREACTNRGINADAGLTARVSAALVDAKYTDALVLLAEMRLRNQRPKLGALCRWVRELDAVSGLSSDSTVPATEKQAQSLRLLDMVLRATGPVDEASPLKPGTGPVAVQKLWDIGRVSPRRVTEEQTTLCAPDVKKAFSIVERTSGPDRKPPNLYPALLHLSSNNAVPLSAIAPKTTRHAHPIVPALSLLTGVLSAEECKLIVTVAESIGFLPDAPLQDDGSDSSILAHNVYWVVDTAFHDVLWDRVRAHMPSHVAGRRARGINRRFRVYRYVPGAEYRCHFDGAWPPSGIDATTGKYVYDASPPTAKQSSLFTFLLYLNDDFQGGETTFFTPSIKEGVMNAHPVRPVMGAAALFPHGEIEGALLHEGTGVRKGAKYIIRTEVEYDVDPGRE